MGPTTPVVHFNTLIKEIFAHVGRCDASCDAIKKNRHCGSHHAELDALQASLKAGVTLLKSAADEAAKNSPSAEELAKADGPVAGFAKEITHVCHKLEKISKGHHDSAHHVEHPHFKELRLRWETAREGLLSILRGFRSDKVAEVAVVKLEAHVEVKEVKSPVDDLEGQVENKVEGSKLDVTVVKIEEVEKVAETH